ncbi:MAG: hypothetical protein JWR15_3062 [Prosthecobacter sp.]|nr:hypothetical protein [Prosthecobacter sp.]
MLYSGHIEAGEFSAFRRQPVHLGRAMQLRTKAAEVAVAEIVHEDDNDVRLRSEGADGKQQEEAECFHGHCAMNPNHAVRTMLPMAYRGTDLHSNEAAPRF